jgi:hypothetical protein
VKELLMASPYKKDKKIKKRNKENKESYRKNKGI